MTTHAPSVAVVITYYCDAEYFPDALRSVLDQSVPPAEIVVVDDASPEGFAVPPIADPRVRVVRRDRNGGPGAARQTGVDATVSEWIAFLDADDVWLPTKLERQFDVIRAQPEIAMHHTGLITVYADGQEVERIGKPHVLSLRDQLRRNQAMPSATIIRREALLDVEGWSADRGVMEDWDLGIRLVAAGHRVGFLPEALVRFRRFGHGNLSSRGLRHMGANLGTLRRHLSLYRRELGWLGTLAVAGRVVHDEGCRRGGLSGLVLRGVGRLFTPRRATG